MTKFSITYFKLYLILSSHTCAIEEMNSKLKVNVFYY